MDFSFQRETPFPTLGATQSPSRFSLKAEEPRGHFCFSLPTLCSPCCSALGGNRLLRFGGRCQAGRISCLYWESPSLWGLLGAHVRAPDLSVEEEKGEQDEGPPLFNASHHPHFGDPRMAPEMSWERVVVRTRQRTKKSKPTPANLARQGGP